ncbi:MAG TPA: amino acid adenylation domain-containing protein [Micromonosporaceae bacterium]|nr:amino acid adenylation domain-containing protein [Micromonosporaceae bacterium]
MADTDVEILDLPTDRPRPAHPTGHIDAIEYVPADTLAATLRGLGVDPHAALLAGLLLTLSRYTGQEEMVAAAPPPARRPIPVTGTFRELAERCTAAPGAPDTPETNAPAFTVRVGDEFTGEGFTTPRGGAGLRVAYATDRFDGDRMARLVGHVGAALERAAQAPDRPVGDLDILPEAERHTLLVAWNDTATDFGDDRTVPERIAAQCAATPDAVAVRFADHELTYAEFDRRTNRLAHHLISLGIGANDIVAVFADRSIELVEMIIGIAKAGAAYLPLDPVYPTQRLAFLLDDTAARAVLTQRHLADRLPATACPVIRLDADRADLERSPDTAPGVRPAPDHLSYVIYTSGSTGNPKGVMVEHAAIRNRLQWMQREYPIGVGDTVLQKTPATFDVSVWEFFWPLMVGARMVLARPDGHRDNAYLVDLIRAERVTTIHFVPAMLRYFLAAGHAAEATDLVRIFCSGEALSADLRDRCFATLPQVELHNLYGPTEAAVDVTYWQCLPEHTEPAVPIGRPIANIRCYILDPAGRPVPVGVDGELHLAGIGLARGYLNRPELTAEKFVPDPFDGTGTGRMYRTGDVVRWRPDGAIAFLGRNDDQVKLGGQRVELGEIEAALIEHPRVTGAAVVSHRPDDSGIPVLVAYVTGFRAADRQQEKELLDFVQQRLPIQLVPTSVTFLDAFPQTTSGKLDRKRLPKPVPAGLADVNCLVPLTPPGSTPPWYWVHPVDGAVEHYTTLAGLLAPHRPGAGLEALGLDGEEPLDAVPAIAARHVAEVRLAQPTGPYHLGGWSVGGLIAYEMACQLRAAGATVAALVLLDTEPPAVTDAGNAPTGVPATEVAATEAPATEVAAATLRAASTYAPPAYDGTVTLITSGPARWRPPAETVHHVVPAEPGALLRTPAVEAVAARLSSVDHSTSALAAAG